MRRSIVALCAIALAACSPKPAQPVDAQTAGAARTPESAYARPPAVLAVQRLAGGRLAVSGKAAPGSRVRIAWPGQAAVFTPVGRDGAWRAILPASGETRLFEVVMLEKQRPIQAEGYLALTPDGRGALLRSGSGAEVLGQGGGAVRILAIDFDDKGAAVVSGVGAPGTVVGVRIDDALRGQTPVEQGGRFMVAVEGTLGPGDHMVEAADAAGGARAAASVVPARPLTQVRFRAERTTFGWRIDWTTPAGGVQTTLLLATSEPAT